MLTNSFRITEGMQTTVLRVTTHWLLYSVAKVSCLLLSLHTFWVVLSVCLDYYILLLLWHHTGLFCHPASPIALLWSKVEEKQLLKKLLPPSPWKTSSSAAAELRRAAWWPESRYTVDCGRASQYYYWAPLGSVSEPGSSLLAADYWWPTTETSEKKVMIMISDLNWEEL